MKYTIKQVTTEYDLDRVQAFAKKIFCKDVLGLAVQNRKDWVGRMTHCAELMLFAEAGNVDDFAGEVIAVVLSYLEDNGNITSAQRRLMNDTGNKALQKS